MSSLAAVTATKKVEKEATEVIIHPLVLLSVADHYNRIAKDSQNRVVGVLLGNRSGGKVDISNSFAVPFEEDLINPSVWFLDHNFLYTMYWMFKKVNSNEEIVGFYSSGPKIKENDLKVSEDLAMTINFCHYSNHLCNHFSSFRLPKKCRFRLCFSNSVARSRFSQ